MTAGPGGASCAGAWREGLVSSRAAEALCRGPRGARSSSWWVERGHAAENLRAILGAALWCLARCTAQAVTLALVVLAGEDDDIVLASFREQQQQYQALMKGLQVRRQAAFLRLTLCHQHQHRIERPIGRGAQSRASQHQPYWLLCW